MTEVSNFYSKLWQTHPLRQPDVNTFLKKVGLQREWFKDKKCLDAGCGYGKNTVILTSMNAKVEAIDLCDLTEIKRLLSYSLPKSNLYIHKADIRDLPYEDETFDFVLCEGVIHHMVEYKQAFKELARVTKKGGILVIAVYGKGGLITAMFSVLRRLPKFLKTPLLKLGVSGHIIYDILTVPILLRFTEREVKEWFGQRRFDCYRKTYQYYDYRKTFNRFLFGEGWIIMKGVKA